MNDLPDFASAHVLVVGDVMLDRSLRGVAERISPEAPVPVLRIEAEATTPGGAANVAVGIAALGARCELFGFVGDDADGASLAAQLEAAGVAAHLEVVTGWPTISKTRALHEHQQLLRIDSERPLPVDAAASRRALFDAAIASLPRAQMLVCSDYGKGVLDEAAPLLAAAKAAGVPVVVDPKAGPAERWRGARVLKPNRKELFDLTASAPDEAPEVAAQRLRRDAAVDVVIATLGAEGLLRVGAGDEVRWFPSRSTEVFDVTGAGDTVCAVLAASLAAGVDVDDAAQLANHAGGVAVTQPGVAVVDRARLAQGLGPRTSVRSREELVTEVALARRRGERIVFTNGCFDLLHAGHVQSLREAAALGDRLVVALNDDASVARLKGEGRPINPAALRASVLAALSVVDWVTIFEEDTPEALLEALRPDVLAKGGDYAPEDVVGAERVRGWGGEVVVLGHVADLSSTALLARLKDAGRDV